MVESSERRFAVRGRTGPPSEWQQVIIKTRKEPLGPTRVGTQNIETRRVPGGQEISSRRSSSITRPVPSDRGRWARWSDQADRDRPVTPRDGREALAVLPGS